MCANIANQQDIVRHFLFEQTDIRGEWTTVGKSYQDALKRHQYPEAIRKLLGEFIAAACLLSTTIKFDGTLSIQAKGDGDISLIVAECTSQQNIRAIAHMKNSQPADDFRSLLQGGQIAITIDPVEGQRYQGIVPLEGDSLAECLEAYFAQSEQLDTKIWLFADDSRAAGMLLQALPLQESSNKEDYDENWCRITQLASTVSPHEMLNLDHETVLHRLFHEETVRLFDSKQVNFQCTCSRDRTAQALKSLGHDDANSIIEKKGSITVDCQFCGHRYSFNKYQVEEIFKPTPPILH